MIRRRSDRRADARGCGHSQVHGCGRGREREARDGLLRMDADELEDAGCQVGVGDRAAIGVDCAGGEADGGGVEGVGSGADDPAAGDAGAEHEGAGDRPVVLALGGVEPRGAAHLEATTTTVSSSSLAAASDCMRPARLWNSAWCLGPRASPPSPPRRTEATASARVAQPVDSILGIAVRPRSPVVAKVPADVLERIRFKALRRKLAEGIVVLAGRGRDRPRDG